MRKPEYPCGFIKAGHIKHAICVLGWSVVRAAQTFEVDGGTCSQIARGKRYKKIPPMPF